MVDIVHKIVKIFNKPKSAEVLDDFVFSKFKRIIRLQKDTPTRWTSLHSMLSKFLKLYDSIENALIKCKQEKFITIEESKVLEGFDKDKLKRPCQALDLLVTLTEQLSKSDCTLIQADECKKFVVDELAKLKGSLPSDLLTNPNKRFDERETKYTEMVRFLNNKSVKNLDDVKLEIKMLAERVFKEEDSFMESRSFSEASLLETF